MKRNQNLKNKEIFFLRNRAKHTLNSSQPKIGKLTVYIIVQFNKNLNNYQLNGKKLMHLIL